MDLAPLPGACIWIRKPFRPFYFDLLTHQSFPGTLLLTARAIKEQPLSKDMTWTNFSSSGSLRNIFVFVESSFLSTRKSFWDSMISMPCLSSCVCTVDRSMSRHFDSACWKAFSETSARSSSSRGVIVLDETGRWQEGETGWGSG